MAYSDFTFDLVRHTLGVNVRDEPLFENVGDLVPSPWLRETLQKGMDPALVSEKSRGEFIVAPVLIECRERLGHQINIFSGVRLDVDPEKGLKGECDYILARSPSAAAIVSPLMLILEAKRHDIEEGTWQCAAQLYAACRFNERDGKIAPYLYGCVTNGESWLFMRLQGNQLALHPRRLTFAEISKILWFLVECLQDVDQKVSEAA